MLRYGFPNLFYKAVFYRMIAACSRDDNRVQGDDIICTSALQKILLHVFTHLPQHLISHQQLIFIKWLFKIGSGPLLQAFNLTAHVGICGEHNYRNVAGVFMMA